MTDKNTMVSVCMATYNGEKFIKEQIESILIQLGGNDELIIVDDCSQDHTLQIINDFNDKRIQLYRNEVNRGHVYTFSKAVSLSKNQYIFFADQDDIWVQGRLKKMKDSLIKTGVNVLSSNFDLLLNDGAYKQADEWRLYNRDSSLYLKNILNIFMGKRSYLGCAMAFCRDINNIVFPIPRYVESHDLWLAIAANLTRSNLHMEEVTIVRRIHGNNTSGPNRNFMLKIRARIIFLVSLFHLTLRIFRSKKIKYNY